MKTSVVTGGAIVLSLFFLRFGCGGNSFLSLKGNSVADGANNKKALDFMESRTGLSLPSCSVVVDEGDGGGRDPSFGYYDWAVFSSEKIVLPPQILPSGEYGYYDQPRDWDSIRDYVQSRFKGHKFDKPEYCSYTSWKTNGYIFRGHLVRTSEGDFLVVMQFREK